MNKRNKSLDTGGKMITVYSETFSFVVKNGKNLIFPKKVLCGKVFLEFFR